MGEAVMRGHPHSTWLPGGGQNGQEWGEATAEEWERAREELMGMGI